MTKETMNERLLAKMENEQDKYFSCMLHAGPFCCIHMCRRYHVQEDILRVLHSNPLPAEEAAALLRSDSPLFDVYSQWEKMKSQRDDLVISAVEKSIDTQQYGFSMGRKEGGSNE